MDYDTYEVRIELEGHSLTTEMEILQDYRGNEQAIYNEIMDSLMLEWDLVED